MRNILKKAGVVLSVLMKLFLVLIIASVGFVSILSWLGVVSPADAIIASQLSMLVFGIVLYDFKRNKVLDQLKSKVDKEILFQALKATAIVLTINVVLGNILNTNGETSETVEGLINEMSFLSAILLPVIIAPLFEELAFRGGLKYVLIDKYKFSNVSYIIISSVIFGSLHYQPGPLALTHVLLTTMMGIIYSSFYLKYKNIYVPMISHLLYNGLVMAVAFGLK